MAYTHLTMEDLGWIETYHTIGLFASKIANKLKIDQNNLSVM